MTNYYQEQIKLLYKQLGEIDYWEQPRKYQCLQDKLTKLHQDDKKYSYIPNDYLQALKNTPLQKGDFIWTR